MIKRVYDVLWLLDTNEYLVIAKDVDQADNHWYSHSGPFDKAVAYEIQSALQIKNNQENR